MNIKKHDLEAVLRREIKASGMTRYMVAKKARLSTAQVLRFMTGERSLCLPAASRLAELLGLELVKGDR